MTDTALDLAAHSAIADEDVLATLFLPPVEIRESPEWVERFNALVRSLRRDSSGLPLDMAQTMLIERIASTYIRLLWFQATGGMSDAQLDKLNEMYLKFVTQFQKILQSSDEALRQDLLKKSMDICQGAVDKFDDPSAKLLGSEVRQVLRQHFNSEFAAMGW